MKQYLLSQDLGVFSCKACLYTLNGELVRSNITLYDPQYNKSRWAWQKPELWWDAFCKNCRILLHDIEPQAVEAVSLCAQMMGCLPVDRAGHPLADSIIWEDGRSQIQAQQLAEKLGIEQLHRITGLRGSSNFTLSKMMWLRENQPEIYEKTYKFLPAKDYINLKMTGVMATDPTDAGFTQAFDLLQNCWSDTMFDVSGIDLDKMPQVIPVGTVLGGVTAEAALMCGLYPGTKVVEGLGDGRAAALGAGIFHPGEGCIYLGSSSWVTQITEKTNLDATHRLSKTSYFRPGLYTNGGTMLAGRLSADWFIREFFSEPFTRAMQQGQDTYRFLDTLVSQSRAGSNGLLFLPYLMGERAPWWNNDARGGFLGLRSTHTKYDFCRSVLEGVCFNLGIIKNSIEQLEPFSEMMRMVGGGANSHQWQQILSDVLDHPITCTNVTGDVGCVGAAVCAGVGGGIFDDFSEVRRFHRIERITTPIAEHVALYRELIPAFEDCYYALRDINLHLSRF